MFYKVLHDWNSINTLQFNKIKNKQVPAEFATAGGMYHYIWSIYSCKCNPCIQSFQSNAECRNYILLLLHLNNVLFLTYIEIHLIPAHINLLGGPLACKWAAGSYWSPLCGTTVPKSISVFCTNQFRYFSVFTQAPLRTRGQDMQ